MLAGSSKCGLKNPQPSDDSRLDEEYPRIENSTGGS
jgi:hypothetical protein